MSIQLPAILTGFATKVDGGASVRFNTNELSDTDVLELKRNQGVFGWLLFSPNKFTTDDLPKEQAEDKDKTPSKRLRNALYVLYHQKTKDGTSSGFERFYGDYMDKEIQKVKDQLI